MSPSAATRDIISRTCRELNANNVTKANKFLPISIPFEFNLLSLFHSCFIAYFQQLINGSAAKQMFRCILYTHFLAKPSLQVKPSPQTLSFLSPAQNLIHKIHPRHLRFQQIIQIFRFRHSKPDRVLSVKRFPKLLILHQPFKPGGGIQFLRQFLMLHRVRMPRHRPPPPATTKIILEERATTKRATTKKAAAEKVTLLSK